MARGKLFCCGFKLGFFAFSVEFRVSFVNILKQKELHESKHVAVV